MNYGRYYQRFCDRETKNEFCWYCHNFDYRKFGCVDCAPNFRSSKIVEAKKHTFIT